MSVSGKLSTAITKHEAEKLLEAPKKGNVNGAFVLRPSENIKGAFGIAVTCNRSISHYRITLFKPSMKYGIQDGLHFKTLDELVAHYQRDKDGLICELTQNVAETLDVPKSFLKQMSLSGQKAIPLAQLSSGDFLGEGQFGEVTQGTWFNAGIIVPVAIKYLKKTDAASKKEFQKEAVRLAAFDHKYVNRMYGVCVENGLALVMELVPLGALNTYLKKETGQIPVPQLEEFIHQIALGMDYLEQHRVLHRDLAARNILVKAKNHVQIADFGLSRVTDETEDYYQSQTKGKWPIKWYALECIYFRKFSHKSDVWSFGVTAWEILSFGQKPYGKLKGQQVVKLLDAGIRLQQPDGCSEELYELLLRCWNTDSKARPTFKAAASEMKKIRNVNKDKVDYTKGRVNAISNQELYDTLPERDEVEFSNQEDRSRVRNMFGAGRKLFTPSSVTLDHTNIVPATPALSVAGTFGQVIKGVIKDTNTTVAVTWIERSATFNPHRFQSTMERLAVLKSCSQLLRFYGISEDPTTKVVLIISEWAPLGPLNKYLMSKRIQSSNKLLFCTQVAAAMKFMESKGIVHRNLAARNVFVMTANEVKVGNFGVSEALNLGTDFYRSSDKCRLKWQPMESFVDNAFTTKSDVWSFGITMWEIFSDGAVPYGSKTGSEVMKYLLEGSRLSISAAIKSSPVAVLMQTCWEEIPEFRPTFSDLYESLSTTRM